uniref:Uncharacterized protein n=1 Tax=viral metagenome TaxID=1070528 RepID=A0A6C0L4A3_9ZZZZ|tara:strand:- start:4835 stop:5920 length:1086 start_codon:yes stop_codon:yes gene_type:complete
MKQDSTNLLLAVILLSFMIYLYCYLPNSEVVEGNTTEDTSQDSGEEAADVPSPNHYCGDCQVVQDLICSRDVEDLTDDHKRYIAGCLTKLNKVDNEKLNDSIDDWINCGSGGKSCSFVKKVMSDLNKKGVENPEEGLKDWLQKKGVAIKNKPKEAAEDPEALNNILKSLLCPINDFESCPELSPTDRAKQLILSNNQDMNEINGLIEEGNIQAEILIKLREHKNQINVKQRELYENEIEDLERASYRVRVVDAEKDTRGDPYNDEKEAMNDLVKDHNILGYYVSEYNRIWPLKRGTREWFAGYHCSPDGDCRQTEDRCEPNCTVKKVVDRSFLRQNRILMDLKGKLERINNEQSPVQPSDS